MLHSLGGSANLNKPTPFLNAACNSDGLILNTVSDRTDPSKTLHSHAFQISSILGMEFRYSSPIGDYPMRPTGAANAAGGDEGKTNKNRRRK